MNKIICEECIWWFYDSQIKKMNTDFIFSSGCSTFSLLPSQQVLTLSVLLFWWDSNNIWWTRNTYTEVECYLPITVLMSSCFIMVYYKWGNPLRTPDTTNEHPLLIIINNMNSKIVVSYFLLEIPFLLPFIIVDCCTHGLTSGPLWNHWHVWWIGSS